MRVEAHILVGNPDQGKAANQVPAPVIEQELVAREPQKKDGHIMTEAVFTGKKKKELAPEKSPVCLALVNTIVAWLFEDLFMGHRPRDGSNGQRQQKQPENLDGKRHLRKEEFCRPQVAFRLNLMLLYYITERRQFIGKPEEQRRRLLHKIAECAAAGVDYIQLREKDLSARQLEELTHEAVQMMKKGPHTRLLINSRIDVALACGAAGVHLPANDLPASEVRAIFASAGVHDPVIGVSAHSADEVAYAEAHGADFAVFGPIFEKDQQLSSEGLEHLRNACKRPRVGNPMPVLALGGVTLGNAQQCLQAGAAGIAGIRLFQQNRIEETVRLLRETQKQGL